MRVNIYAEELTDRVELIEKEIEGNKFVALRFYTELPVTVSAEAIAQAACLSAPQMYRVKPTNFQGPFIHRPGDDDSAAVTFWGKQSMRNILQKALSLLDQHYNKQETKLPNTKEPTLDWEYQTIKVPNEVTAHCKTDREREVASVAWRITTNMVEAVNEAEDSQPNLLSSTALSNLYTMGCTAKVDPRQEIPAKPYTIPPEETRRLRARLILEEALETIEGLGFHVQVACEDEEKCIEDLPLTMKTAIFGHSKDGPNLEKIIDGCCDTKYVSVGTLVACGVCDEQHMEFVNRANNAKFPKGEAKVNEHGKFQKPPGWEAPHHLGTTCRMANLRRKSNQLVLDAQKGG